jgi:Uncharacterized protein involved in cation transport
MQVFAYGSLMWRPGFTPKAAARAKAIGWHRKWCVRSIVHRGSPSAPGVVLGLAEGGICEGILYTVDPAEELQVASYLDQREMAEPGYLPKIIDVSTADGLTKAITYVSDSQKRYCDNPANTVGRILTAKGLSGSNIDYATQTFAAVERLGAAICEQEIGLPLQLLSTIQRSAAITGADNADIEWRTRAAQLA